MSGNSANHGRHGMSGLGEVGVRWEQPGDARAEAAVRATDYTPGHPRHLYWPRPPGKEAFGGVLLAEIDGRVIGRAHVEAVYPPFAEIQNMQVMPAFRGRGAGGAILEACFSHLRRQGFMGVFLQTHFGNPTAHRLYARKGFLAAAKGRMLRLVRFLEYPLLDDFLHQRPLATYRGPVNVQERHWPLVWEDWASGDRLSLTLTGGSSDKDSDEYGPGLSGVETRIAGRDFVVHLAAPATVQRDAPFQVPISVKNRAADPLLLSARLLLPSGCQPTGEWSRSGPELTLAGGEEKQVCFEAKVTGQCDLGPLQRASFTSLPLTVEVFAAGSSFWLAHGVMVGGEGDPGRPGQRPAGLSGDGSFSPGGP